MKESEKSQRAEEDGSAAALVFGPMVLPFFPEYGHVILEQHPDKPVDYQVQETRLDARSQIEG